MLWRVRSTGVVLFPDPPPQGGDNGIHPQCVFGAGRALAPACTVRDMTTPELRTYRQLRDEGWTRHRLTGAVRSGALVRLRRGRYVVASVDSTVQGAARLGGRLDCVSLLSLLGVFVLDRGRLHVQFDREASRLPERPAGVVAHWRSSVSRRGDLHADLLEALVQAVVCQGPRAGIASVDSALHLGLIADDQVDLIFEKLPRRYRRLRNLVDGSAESGPETYVRLILRALGARYETQVRIRGVGRVDFLVEGWLIVECDSRAHHSSWEAQLRDRRRDRAAAASGYLTLRLVAEEILYSPELVRVALAGVVKNRRRSR